MTQQASRKSIDELGSLQQEEPSPAAGEWQSLKQRVLALLAGLDIQPGRKLHGWALERLAVLADKDVQFMHLLLKALEQRIGGRPPTDN